MHLTKRQRRSYRAAAGQRSDRPIVIPCRDAVSRPAKVVVVDDELG